jgi:hypothetical protein
LTRSTGTKLCCELDGIHGNFPFIVDTQLEGLAEIVGVHVVFSASLQ